ncbi:MAG: hypothetical protein CMH98_08210 [Oceanospirillaceae bacterium]|nr:hypothetical protein [Oceanospirillaceae bacterium]
MGRLNEALPKYNGTRSITSLIILIVTVCATSTRRNLLPDLRVVVNVDEPNKTDRDTPESILNELKNYLRDTTEMTIDLSRFPYVPPDDWSSTIAELGTFYDNFKPRPMSEIDHAEKLKSGGVKDLLDRLNSSDATTSEGSDATDDDSSSTSSISTVKKFAEILTEDKYKFENRVRKFTRKIEKVENEIEKNKVENFQLCKLCELQKVQVMMNIRKQGMKDEKLANSVNDEKLNKIVKKFEFKRKMKNNINPNLNNPLCSDNSYKFKNCSGLKRSIAKITDPNASIFETKLHISDFHLSRYHLFTAPNSIVNDAMNSLLEANDTFGIRKVISECYDSFIFMVKSPVGHDNDPTIYLKLFDEIGRIEKIIQYERWHSCIGTESYILNGHKADNSSRILSFDKRNMKNIQIILNHFKLQVFFKYIEKTKFNHFKKVRAWFNKIGQEYNEKIRAIGGVLDPKRMIYHIISPFFHMSYIGKTNRTFADRFFDEHLKQISMPIHDINDIPAYKVLRRMGIEKFLVVPLAVLRDATEAELYEAELGMIRRYRSTLNTPYVYQLMNGDSSGRYLFKMVKKNKNANGANMRKKHLLHDSFTEGTVFKEKASMYADDKTCIDTNEIVRRLGTVTCKYNSTLRFITKMAGKNPNLGDVLVRKCMIQLGGASRKIALLRLTKITKIAAHTFVRIRLPTMRGFDYKKMFVERLKQNNLIKGPLILNVTSKASLSMNSILSNHRTLNKVIDIPEFFPCNCNEICDLVKIKNKNKSMNRKFFDENGHFCSRLYDFFPEFDNFPVGTRVYPELKVLWAGIQKGINNLFEKRAEIFNVQNKTVLNFHLKDILEGYEHFLNNVEMQGFPREKKVRELSMRIQQICVVTDLVDKDRHHCAIMCPMNYKERMEKLWLHNPSYSILKNWGEKSNSNKIKLSHDKLKFGGIKFAKNHQIGWANCLPKKKDVVGKSRPLVSYEKHGLKPILSLSGRAGLEIIKRAVPINSVVASTTDVVDRFIESNISLKFSTVTKTIVGKGDIENFFPNTPRVILLDGAKWLLKKYDECKRCPEEFLAMPIGTYRMTTKNALFLNFTSWKQLRSYRNGLRRQWREKFRPIFMQKIEDKPKGYAVIKISDIFKAIELDLDNAIIKFGENIFMRQILGITQGSPIAVFEAVLTAVYLEDKNWGIFVKSMNLLFDPVQWRINLMRWVDDVFYRIDFFEKMKIKNGKVYNGESVVCDEKIDKIFELVSEIYTPFNLKKEDANEFVGLKVHQNEFEINLSVCEPKNIPHFNGNITKSQVKGMMCGCILRALDSSTTPELVEVSLRGIIGYAMKFGYDPLIFYYILKEMEKKYVIFEDIKDKLFPPPLPFWLKQVSRAEMHSPNGMPNMSPSGMPSNFNTPGFIDQNNNGNGNNFYNTTPYQNGQNNFQPNNHFPPNNFGSQHGGNGGKGGGGRRFTTLNRTDTGRFEQNADFINLAVSQPKGCAVYQGGADVVILPQIKNPMITTPAMRVKEVCQILPIFAPNDRWAKCLKNLKKLIKNGDLKVKKKEVPVSEQAMWESCGYDVRPMGEMSMSPTTMLGKNLNTSDLLIAMQRLQKEQKKKKKKEKDSSSGESSDDSSDSDSSVSSTSSKQSVGSTSSDLDMLNGKSDAKSKSVKKKLVFSPEDKKKKGKESPKDPSSTMTLRSRTARKRARITTPCKK